MVCGKPPFEGATAIVVLKMHGEQLLNTFG